MDRQTTAQDINANTQRKLVRSLYVLGGVIITSSIGFAYVEGWSIWRGLYFTFVTITTVGYGDEGISELGRILSVALMIGGTGIVSYTFALFVQSAVTEQLVWRPCMQKRIDQLENHTIICGFGRMGRTICDQLRRVDKPFVVIERDPEGFRYAHESGFFAIEGLAVDDEILFQAGIEKAAHLVSAVDSEADNIAITLTARDLQPDITIIARAEREEDVRKPRRAGADRIVAPFQSGGVEVANAILRPKVVDFLAHSQQTEHHFVLSEIPIEKGSLLANRQLRECGQNEGHNISFVALERGDEEVAVSPRGSEMLQVGDVLIITGHPDDVLRMQESAQPNAQSIAIHSAQLPSPSIETDQALL